jgi:DMSO/TMAO reductase YedYZ heme-binding membrane subunit
MSQSVLTCRQHASILCYDYDLLHPTKYTHLFLGLRLNDIDKHVCLESKLISGDPNTLLLFLRPITLLRWSTPSLAIDTHLP